MDTSSGRIASADIAHKIHSAPASPGSTGRSPIVDKSLNVYLETKQNRTDLKWGVINVLVLSVLLFDISNKCPYAFSKWYYLEYAAAASLSLSVLYYFIRIFHFWFTFEPIKGTQEQRRLLRFDDGGKTSRPNLTSLPSAITASR